MFHVNDAALNAVRDNPDLDEKTKELFVLLLHRQNDVRVQAIEQFCRLMRSGHVRVHGFPPAPCVLAEMAKRIGPKKKLRVDEFFNTMMLAMGNFPEAVP